MNHSIYFGNNLVLGMNTWYMIGIPEMIVHTHISLCYDDNQWHKTFHKCDSAYDIAPQAPIAIDDLESSIFVLLEACAINNFDS